MQTEVHLKSHDQEEAVCGHRLTGTAITEDMPTCGQCLMLFVTHVEGELATYSRALRLLESHPQPSETAQQVALRLHQREGLDGACGSPTCVCGKGFVAWADFTARIGVVRSW